MPFVIQIIALVAVLPAGALRTGGRAHYELAGWHPHHQMLQWWGGLLIAIAVALVLVILILRCCVIVVRQEKAVCMESMGRFSRVLGPGIHFVKPIVEHPRKLLWRRPVYTRDGSIQLKTQASPYIDLREDVLVLRDLDVFTKDHITLNVACFLTYNIFDAKRCLYEVENLHGALSNTIQSCLNEVFAEMPFAQALNGQVTINQLAKERFGPVFNGWGVRMHGLEILNINPVQLISTLQQQMIQERTRRSDLIEADAEREAMKLIADGAKTVLQNKGTGEQTTIQKLSEGRAQSNLLLVESEAVALQKLQRVMAASKINYGDYIMSRRQWQVLFGDNLSSSKSFCLEFLRAPGMEADDTETP